MLFNRRNILRLLPLVVFFLLTLALAGGLLSPKKGPGEFAPIVGTRLPDFALPKLDAPSSLVVSKNWRGGVVVLNVFASWCVPCQAEHPLLMKLASERGAVIHGIAWRDSFEKAQAYLTQLGNPYRSVAVDGIGQATVPLGITGVPETYLIDKQGIVRWKYSGPLDEKIIAEQLTPLMDYYAAAP